jgi:hypothetical protein
VKRTTYRVQLTSDGAIIHTGAACAPKTSRLASEAAVREIARQEGQLYSGSADHGWQGEDRYRPDTYRRVWTGDRTGRTIIATVERQP